VSSLTEDISVSSSVPSSLHTLTPVKPDDNSVVASFRDVNYSLLFLHVRNERQRAGRVAYMVRAAA
jgi:hypothetical protein